MNQGSETAVFSNLRDSRVVIDDNLQLKADY
jgi:hypothetical protein